MDKKDFLALHMMIEKASKNKELAKLFDFAGTDGATFDAIWKYSARFETYLTREEDHPNNPNRILKLANPVVFKV